jgi:hypothetical protein
MNTLLQDDPDSVSDNTSINIPDDEANELPETENSQLSPKEKRFDISARRKIEDYLESKRLDAITRDFLFDE